MANVPLSFSWNNFAWWISDNKYQALPWRFYQGFWVNTRGFYMHPQSVNKLENEYVNWINCVFNQEIIWWTWNIIWTNEGEIYEDTTLRTTLTQWTQGYHIGYLVPTWSVAKLYYFYDTIPSISPKYIHRSNIDWSWFEQSYFPTTKPTYTSDDWLNISVPTKVKVFNDWWKRIIFSHCNNVFIMDPSEIITKKLTFPPAETVVWITEFQWQFKIYTNTGFTLSKIYTWDWSSTEYDTSVILTGISIGNVINDWAYDYFNDISWSMYQVAWVQYEKIYHESWISLLWKVWDFIYMNYRNPDGKYSLATYGNLPWYPKWINPHYTIDEEDATNEIQQPTFVDSWSFTYYATYKKLYRIFPTSTAYDMTLYADSLVFTWNNIENRKSIDNTILRFSGATATCKIKLEAQKQENWSWISLWEWINADINAENHWFVLYSQNFLNPIWNFNTLRFRVSFLTNWISTTCRFYWLDVNWKEDVWVK